MEKRLLCTAQDVAIQIRCEVTKLVEQWDSLTRDRPWVARVEIDLALQGDGWEKLLIKLAGEVRAYIACHPEEDWISIVRASQSSPMAQADVITYTAAVRWEAGSDECSLIVKASDTDPGLAMSAEELARLIVEPLLFGDGTERS